MIPRFLPCLAACAGVLLVACSPYPEIQPRSARPGPPPTPVAASAAIGPATVAAPSGAVTPGGGAPPAPAAVNQPPTAPPHPHPAPQQPAEAAKPDLPTARKAPGKEGYVLSPYNNKLILVRGIPSGTVVPDPAFPGAAKKYFRVP